MLGVVIVVRSITAFVCTARAAFTGTLLAPLAGLELTTPGERSSDPARS